MGAARPGEGSKVWIRAALLLCLATSEAVAQAAPRPLPDSTEGIHVFNDRVFAWTFGQAAFAARRYAGTAKQTRAEADLLRSYNPGLVILHYRLGLGIGYRTSVQDCDRAGNWVQYIDGDWVQEWPGDQDVPSAWHFQYGGLPVFMCHWSWWLMDPDRPGFRAWWTSGVQRELQNNDADGVFADSLLVPNFLATTGFDPDLPAYDPPFEQEWMGKLGRWMDFIQSRIGSAYLIPNPGMWVTTRDETDFSKADGLFIEGFASEPWSIWGFPGWRAQQDRMLGLIAMDKVLIGYSRHTWNAERRLFVLASYLAIKGRRTYVNLDLSEAAEWWPEYEIPIGKPLSPPPREVAELFDPSLGVYARRFTNGLVLVNPGSQALSVGLPEPLWLTSPVGGGVVPESGILPPSWRVETSLVTQVQMAPGSGAILLHEPDPFRLEVDPLVCGQHVELRARGARAGHPTWFFITRSGEAETPFPQLGVTLGLANPRAIAVVGADAQGLARATLFPPAALAGSTLWVQAAQTQSATQVVSKSVH